MRTLILHALLLAFILPLQAQDTTQTMPLLHPDSVFTLTADDIEADRRQANALLVGTWQYDKPSVQAQGSNLMSKLGQPIAKSKLKKKLDKAYKKLKLKQRWTSLTLTADGRWTMTVSGKSVSGKYSYSPSKGSLTLSWYGMPMTAQVQRDGKHLHLLFDTDRLLNLLRLLSGISHSETLKALAFLSENYRDVKVGFDLKAID